MLQLCPTKTRNILNHIEDYIFPHSRRDQYSNTPYMSNVNILTYQKSFYANPIALVAQVATNNADKIINLSQNILIFSDLVLRFIISNH